MQDEHRANYVHFQTIQTRWMDNDVYQHVNNVVYYSFFDTVINEYLILKDGLDYTNGSIVGFAVESHCQYMQPISFPEVIDVGIRVGHLGNSSVRYEIGIFKKDEEKPAAIGYFVHVFVERVTGKPTAIIGTIRNALISLQPSQS